MQRLGGDILSHDRLISDKEILQRVSAVTKADITKVAEAIGRTA
jgi:predicted Zn-dependent peptidase